MRRSGIPESVRRFLLTRVESIGQVEVLLLLRSAPEHEWSIDEISRELGSSASSVRDRLALLASQGIVTSRDVDGSTLHHYAPASEETRSMLDALAAAYKEYRVAVTNLIYAGPEGGGPKGEG